MNILEGKLVGENQRVGIVCGRFNEFITSKLLSGAEDCLPSKIGRASCRERV